MPARLRGSRSSRRSPGRPPPPSAARDVDLYPAAAGGIRDLDVTGYLSPDGEVSICDEHGQRIDTNDEPDLVVIQVYITSAYRAHALADHYR
jgi:hypothetical protein